MGTEVEHCIGETFLVRLGWKFISFGRVLDVGRGWLGGSILCRIAVLVLPPTSVPSNAFIIIDRTCISVTQLLCVHTSYILFEKISFEVGRPPMDSSSRLSSHNTFHKIIFQSIFGRLKTEICRTGERKKGVRDSIIKPITTVRCATMCGLNLKQIAGRIPTSGIQSDKLNHWHHE